jgi:hypothetical protein
MYLSLMVLGKNDCLYVSVFDLSSVMMEQDTTRALQQWQSKWNDKNTSAAISYIYSRDR